MLSDVRENLYSNKENSKLNLILNIFLGLMLLTIVFEVVFSVSYTGIYVLGESMDDTLTGAKIPLITVDGQDRPDDYYDVSGDYLYVNKFTKPDYGNIVVVQKDKDTTIIKRVIAKGGDYVKLDKGELWIKYAGKDEFELIEEDYVSEKNNSPENIYNTFYNDNEGYYVKEGGYFLLGDNRNVSLDSRDKGGICYTDEQIIGVVSDWSLKNKSFYTAMHKFFSFDLPNFFGIDNRVKNIKEVD